MEDKTVLMRKFEMALINMQVESDNPEAERVRLVNIYGVNNVWDTQDVSEEFEITGFSAPYCMAIRKSDGVKGLLEFQHHPRFYFAFQKV